MAPREHKRGQKLSQQLKKNTCMAWSQADALGIRKEKRRAGLEGALGHTCARRGRLHIFTGTDVSQADDQRLLTG